MLLLCGFLVLSPKTRSPTTFSQCCITEPKCYNGLRLAVFFPVFFIFGSNFIQTAINSHFFWHFYHFCTFFQFACYCDHLYLVPDFVWSFTFDFTFFVSSSILTFFCFYFHILHFSSFFCLWNYKMTSKKFKVFVKGAGKGTTKIVTSSSHGEFSYLFNFSELLN